MGVRELGHLATSCPAKGEPGSAAQQHPIVGPGVYSRTKNCVLPSLHEPSSTLPLSAAHSSHPSSSLAPPKPRSSPHPRVALPFPRHKTPNTSHYFTSLLLSLRPLSPSTPMVLFSPSPSLLSLASSLVLVSWLYLGNFNTKTVPSFHRLCSALLSLSNLKSPLSWWIWSFP